MYPPTNDTAVLIYAAMRLAEEAFTPGYEYLKAKVIAKGLSPSDEVQGSLFAPPVDAQKREKLMQTLDQLNRKLSPGAVKFGALGLKPTWQMRSDYFSQRYTTHWGELPTVKVWQGAKPALQRRPQSPDNQPPKRQIDLTPTFSRK